MKIRAISLSENRIPELNRKYGLQISAIYNHKFLIEINTQFEDQIRLLYKLSDVFDIYKTNNRHTCLVGLKNIPILLNRDYTPELAGIVHKLNVFFSKQSKAVWHFDKINLDFNAGPFVMGIINVTPDSFYDGAKYNNPEKAVDRALKMVEEGAAVIDVGGESTRPGAEEVPPHEELARVIPVIKEIKRRSDVLISVDTYKSMVAKEALNAGADIVNDISGGDFDNAMFDLIKEYNCPYIIMHIKGTPKNMQQNPQYTDVVEEIYGYFEKKLQILEGMQIRDIMIDPGIGFGKRLQDNLHLIRDLKDFTFLNYPILIGASRKSMIGQVLNNEKEERLYGSLSVHLQAAFNGADFIRTHDVKETFEVLQMFKAVNNPEKFK